MSISLPRLEKFSVTDFFKWVFYIFLFSSSQISMMERFACLLSKRSLNLSFFFLSSSLKTFFSSCYSAVCFPLHSFPDHGYILLHPLVCWWFPLLCCLVHYCILQLWFFLIFSIALLNFHGVLPLFSSPVRTFRIITCNFLSGILLISVSLLFLSFFFLFFFLEHILPSPHLAWLFSMD